MNWRIFIVCFALPMALIVGMALIIRFLYPTQSRDILARLVCERHPPGADRNDRQTFFWRHGLNILGIAMVPLAMLLSLALVDYTKITIYTMAIGLGIAFYLALGGIEFFYSLAILVGACWILAVEKGWITLIGLALLAGGIMGHALKRR